MNADEILKSVSNTMYERSKTYDKQTQNERSIPKVVELFNILVERPEEYKMTEQEGWLFMQLLKEVRLWANPDEFHEDSAHDGIAYATLKTESFYHKD